MMQQPIASRLKLDLLVKRVKYWKDIREERLMLIHEEGEVPGEPHVVHRIR